MCIFQHLDWINIYTCITAVSRVVQPKGQAALINNLLSVELIVQVVIRTQLHLQGEDMRSVDESSRGKYIILWLFDICRSTSWCAFFSVFNWKLRSPVHLRINMLTSRKSVIRSSNDHEMVSETYLNNIQSLTLLQHIFDSGKHTFGTLSAGYNGSTSTCRSSFLHLLWTSNTYVITTNCRR